MTGNVALVTGGARGIGLGISRRLLEDGYRVAANGVRPPEDVEPVLAELAGLGEVIYVRGDVGDAAARDEVVAATLAALDRIDVLVNNAGITSPGRNDMLAVNEADFDTVMAVNLKGPFLLTQAVARRMIEQHDADPSFRGRIINISSISAVLASTNRAEYCISKAGVSMATKLWASRLAEHDIDVYEVRPGIVESDMTVGVKEKYDDLIEHGLTLDKRWGTPDDVGRAVSALARGEIPYATGQVLTVDGGLTVPRL
ncbi:MAG: 3-ketoacyl-ACP reductase [Acidimicrobiia bacterium]|nr:MAG: 3-ketoacyl-ACP reductase [Acidimicrobiia bacterium]